MSRLLLLPLFACGALLTSGCQTTSSHDHAGHAHAGDAGVVTLKRADYPHLPCGRFSESLRAKGDANPAVAARFFWGNYGGPGCLGGEPVDVLDRFFYQHDVAYLEGVKMRELRAADRLLVRQLRGVDPGGLTPAGQKYRKRAMFYFRMPLSRWIGKPADVLLRTKREPSVIWE